MLMRETIAFLYKFITYGVFLTGLWIWFRPIFFPGYRSVRFLPDNLLSGIFRIQKIMTYGNSYILYRHCDRLLQAAWKWYKPGTALFFFIISISLFIASLSVYYQIIGVGSLSVFLSTASALLPYILLRVRLALIRSDTSHQLVPAAAILLASYRVCSKDIYFSIIKSIEKLENNTLQRSFILLAKSIQCHTNIREIEEAVDLFVYKIQTSWAKQLGVLLSGAIIDGRDIEQSLSHIVKDMKKGQQIIEEEKSNSHDTIIMGYLPLLALPLTILFLQLMSGRFKVLYFQFRTHEGLTSFLITSLLCLAGFILATLFRRPKNDL